MQLGRKQKGSDLFEAVKNEVGFEEITEKPNVKVTSISKVQVERFELPFFFLNIKLHLLNLLFIITDVLLLYNVHLVYTFQLWKRFLCKPTEMEVWKI